MSLGARATKGGARVGKEGGKSHNHDKPGKGPDKPQPKEKVKPQATSEQLRMAHMIDRSKSDDPSDVRRMVLELMDLTCRTEEEVCSALHDADNDMQGACDLLLEESPRIQGEWQTREKKKKKPAVTVGNGEVEPAPRDARSRSGPRPRRGEGEGAGGGARGRGAVRGGRGGGGRGGRAGRGGGARRGGAGARAGWPGPGAHGGTTGDGFPQAEDWDNEEWSGSLTDTKVFTPSTAVVPGTDNALQANDSVEDWDAPAETNNGHSEPHIPTYTYHSASRPPPASPATAGARTSPGEAVPDTHTHTPADTYPPHHTLNPMGMSGTLSAAQSQYLSQLTQQSQRHDNSVYSHNYGVYGSADIARKPQRARVPPPSKIPVSAVEMPGGAEPSAAFLDVQFGAMEPAALRDTPPPKQVTSQPETPAPAPLEPPPVETTPNNSYTNATSMLSESLSSVVDATPNSQPQPQPEPTVTNTTTSLEKQLSSSMKALSVTGASPPAQLAYTPRPKQTVGQSVAPTAAPAGVYPTHAPQHAPYPTQHNVYQPQVNSTNASLTGQPALSAAGYPSSVTLSQYQPIINSYQQQQTSSSAGVYGGAALYTHAPYTYQPHTKLPAKDAQYESAAPSSNSLTNTSTTQTSTAKVTTTTASSAAASVAAYAVQANPALYGQSTSYGYDEQCLRPTLPHHISGYYEVGYGVGGAREGTFGLGAGERFGRADAASPQQVPAALPPGYAYFYQPPPTTYQYGVYPYGGGSNVGGVGGVGGVGSVSGQGKVSTYTQQQPPYEPDTYKAAGGYNASASKSAGGGAAGGDLTTQMYAKAHQALNKVNSYEKATFHSGTPPPFGAASHHLYIPAPPHHHHHHPLQQHQMDVRVNSSQNRRESASGGAGGATGGGRGAGKPAAAKPYSQSYWPPN